MLAAPLAVLALMTASAHAAAPPANLQELVQSEHFVVHYTSTVGDPNAIGESRARLLSANAERAYAAEVVQWGFRAPADDGDQHVDVYVYGLGGSDAGHASWRRRPPASAATISVDPGYVSSRRVIAHELFHVLQAATYSLAPGWHLESTARWAEHELYGGADDDLSYLRRPDVPLDCADACPDAGYRLWLFWGYLEQRFGRDVVRSVFEYQRERYDTVRVRTSGADAIDAVLRRSGSSLAAAFADFAVATATASYRPLSASRLARELGTAPLVAGSTQTVLVDHLAARYLDVRRPAGPCRTATLHVSSTAPEGTTVTWVVGAAATPVRGFADVLWNTCGAHTRLVVANGSVADADRVAVSTSF